MEFKIKLFKKREEVLNTKTFVFEKPKGFNYLAGQYVYLTLPRLDYPDARGDTRHFTLSSSPTEDYLSITVRMRDSSGFKHTLDESPIGSEISMRGPNGDFVLENHASTEHAPTAQVEFQIFIAGGIGVTPFRSIIHYAADKNLTTPIMLICSNSIPEEIPFKAELDEISRTHDWLKVIYTVSKPEESRIKWKGLIGRINEEFFRTHVPTSHFPLSASVFWVCGPPGMVSAMEETLAKLNIPEEQVRVEKFTGY